MMIPVTLTQSLRDYVEKRWQPGGFLTSVLENDLRGACMRADSDSQRCLWDLVGFIYNELPAPCWGSPEKVAKWLEGDA